MRPAWFATFGAFFIWGLSPLFWRQLSGIAATELISYRVVVTMVLLMLLFMLAKNWPTLDQIYSQKRSLFISSLLIGVNWLIFVYAVNQNMVLDVSRGYFLTPLLNIAMGALFFREILDRRQKVALLFALSGTALQFLKLEQGPWISLSLASTFAVYGLVKKKQRLAPLQALFIESLLCSPLAIWYLISISDELALPHLPVGGYALLVLAGFITIVPLTLFAYGVKRLPLSVVGFLQYLAPTLQFAIGHLIFGESLGAMEVLSFVFIWTAIVLIVSRAFRWNSSTNS